MKVTLSIRDGSIEATIEANEEEDYEEVFEKVTGIVEEYSSPIEKSTNPEPESPTDDAYLRIMDSISQRTRFSLLVDIYAHPEGMASLRELTERNTETSKSSLFEHLSVLEDAGIVKQKRVPKSERRRDAPNSFYQLTNIGETLLEQILSLPTMEVDLADRYSSLETDDVRRPKFDDEYEEGKDGVEIRGHTTESLENRTLEQIATVFDDDHDERTGGG